MRMGRGAGTDEEEAVPGEKKKLFRERRRSCSKQCLPEITFALFIILF